MNELAEATWRHWDFQHRHLGRLPYEEAFTDHNMVELGIRHPRQVTYRLFDRTWEAETGADFEWWIVDPVQRVLFPMLVQAKKMNRLGSYEDVGRRLGNDHARPLQIERLIEACRVGFTASQGQTVCAFIRYTPLYLFYNGPLQGQGGAASDRCRNSAVAREARGCSVAAAQDVRSALGDRVDLPAQDVRPVTLPWQCLLCCPTARVLGPGPLRVAGMLAGSAADGDGPWQPALPDSDALPAVWTFDDAPDYVRQMVTGDLPAEGAARTLDTMPGAARVIVWALSDGFDEEAE